MKFYKPLTDQIIEPIEDEDNSYMDFMDKSQMMDYVMKTISREMLEQLLQGKVLAMTVMDEYGLFLKLDLDES